MCDAAFSSPLTSASLLLTPKVFLSEAVSPSALLFEIWFCCLGNQAKQTSLRDISTACMSVAFKAPSAVRAAQQPSLNVLCCVKRTAISSYPE